MMITAPATLKTDRGSFQNTAPASAGIIMDALTNTTVNDISPVANAISLKTPLMAVTPPKSMPRSKQPMEYRSPEKIDATPMMMLMIVYITTFIQT